MHRLAAVIKGVPVRLYERVLIGRDEFNAPIYHEQPVTVDDVLVGEPTAEEMLSSVNLTGRRVAYVLAIPKGDRHEWENCRVDIGAQRFRVFGEPTEGIEANIPLRWNKKVRVERIE